MEEIYRKVLRGEKLTEDEICELYQDPGDDIEVAGDIELLDRGYVTCYSIIKLEGRYFKIYAHIALNGRDRCNTQPIEVIPVKEIKEVTNWIEK